MAEANRESMAYRGNRSRSRFVPASMGIGLTLLLLTAGVPAVRGQGFGSKLSYYEVQFVTPQIGWLDRTDVLRTTDGGRTWAIQRRYGDPAVGTKFTKHMQFLDAMTGWVLYDQSWMHRTSDGGRTWEVIEIRPTAQGANVRHATDLAEFQMVTAQVGYGLNDLGDVFLRTNDGGSIWRAARIRDGRVSFEALAFVDQKKGWVAGVEGVVLTTTDGGQTWQPLPPVPVKTVYSLQFLSATTGWLMETGGPRLFRTDDGARTWRLCGTNPPSTKLRKAFFRTPSLGWAVVAENGVILRTTDGCSTWQATQTPVPQPLNAVHFVDDSNGWAVGANETVLKTSDGGLTWTQVQVNVP